MPTTTRPKQKPTAGRMWRKEVATGAARMRADVGAGAAGVAAGATEGETMPKHAKPVFTAFGAWPWEENIKFQFTWNATSEESLDEKSGIYR